ncbi:MAG: glycosyltransferase family 39 protein [Acidithiobacillales bacterium]
METRRAGRPWILPGLLLLAFLSKLAALLTLGSHPLLQPDAGLDTGAYVGLAWRVAHGDFLLRGDGAVPFFVSPLYIYFLAPILAATAGSLFAARLVQILLGTAAAGLVFAAARRLFGEEAAAVGTALYVLTGVVTFYEVLILQSALDPFLTALALYLLAVGLTSGRNSSKGKKASAPDGGPRSLTTWVATGVAFGLLALNRPNALPCAAVVTLALAVPPFVARLRGGRRLSLPSEEISLRTFGSATAFLFGVGLAVAPVTIRNLAVSHEFVLISSHGGLNFLIGNSPGADGVYRRLEGITPSIAGQAADARRVAQAAEGRPLTTGEVSSYFARKAWSWIAAEPGAAAKLFLRKIWYVLSGDEAPLNFSYPWYRSRSIVLKLLPVGPGLLVPLGGAGLVLLFLGFGRLRPREAGVWVSFTPAYVLLVAAFFVATRYRLPLAPPLAVAAGGGAMGILAAARARDTRRLASAVVVALPLAAVSLWPTGLYDGGADEEMHLVLLEIDRGDAVAMHDAEAAVTAYPDPALFWHRIGEAFAEKERTDEAILAFERSLTANPEQPQTVKLLAAVRERRGVERILKGDIPGAAADLEAAVGFDPENATAHLNLAALLAGRGERDRARAEAQKALSLKPGYEKAEALLKALGTGSK